MAETAATLITDALGGVFAVGTEKPVEQNDINTDMRYLNRMMAKLDSMGISLGYTNVTSPSDDITVADGAISGMIDNLSLMLAPVYGEQVSAELFQNAKEGLAAMRKIAVKIFPTHHPCTLPIGSGNEDSFNDDDHFYGCLNDLDVLNEQGGSILLESET